MPTPSYDEIVAAKTPIAKVPSYDEIVGSGELMDMAHPRSTPDVTQALQQSGSEEDEFFRGGGPVPPTDQKLRSMLSKPDATAGFGSLDTVDETFPSTAKDTVQMYDTVLGAPILPVSDGHPETHAQAVATGIWDSLAGLATPNNVIAGGVTAAIPGSEQAVMSAFLGKYLKDAPETVSEISAMPNGPDKTKAVTDFVMSGLLMGLGGKSTLMRGSKGGTTIAPRQYPGMKEPPVIPDPSLTPKTADALEQTKGMKRSDNESGAIKIPEVFPVRKMTPLDKATTEHSATMQKSTYESNLAQKEIKKVIPSKERQGAVSVWIEANGDLATLQTWEANAKQDWMKKAAQIAQTLTPEEIAIATKAKAAFDVLEARGNAYDVLGNHRDNYVPHVWDVTKPGEAIFGRRLKERFKFNKARSLENFAEGDQAGLKPKSLAIGDLLPAYLSEMNRVIADRQLVQDISQGKAKDGRPLAVPRGVVQVVDTPTDKSVLTRPKAMREEDTFDYKSFPDQPALSKWTWEGKDTAGNPVFAKAELALHPEAYTRLKAIIGKSKLREWYNEPREGLSRIPPTIVKALDISQSVMKREMFGLLSPFHQVQEGTHAIGHLVNPFFNIPKIDLRDAAQADAARHGLQLLSDKTSANRYMEGLGEDSTFLSQGAKKLAEKVPALKKAEVISDIIDGYQHYLFDQYIPGLKFKTYEAIVKRNAERFDKELKSSELNMDDIKMLSAEQTNAAYGHLNYALLDRSPTIQHFLRLGLLAPDFLEARGKFVGQALKGATGSRSGQEQLKAIAVLAVSQAASAYTISQLIGGQWDAKHPFEIQGPNGRTYFLRSVPEDLQRALSFVGGGDQTRQFLYGRINPLTVKTPWQLLSGLNYRGEKVDAIDTLTETLAQFIPINARTLPGVKELTQTTRQNPISTMEQLSGSLGLRVSRHSPITQTYQNASQWMKDQKIDKDKGSYPISQYQQLRYALEDGDMEKSKEEYDKLRKGKSASQLKKGFEESIHHHFTKNAEMDKQFRSSLNAYDRAVYDLAMKKRQEILWRFGKLK